VPSSATSSRPLLGGDGAGEGAALVPEKLALEELVREVGGVDSNERFRGADGDVVDGPSEAVLPGAAFADDEDRGRKVGGALDGRDLARERLIPGFEMRPERTP
jgi:hypothetical protein